jgi:hypothetical protein
VVRALDGVQPSASASVSPSRSRYAYTAAERVTQAWGATVTQTGTAVTADNAAWNGTLPRARPPR